MVLYIFVVLYHRSVLALALILIIPFCQVYWYVVQFIKAYYKLMVTFKAKDSVDGLYIEISL